MTREHPEGDLVLLERWLLRLSHKRAGQYDRSWVMGIAKAVDGSYAVAEWTPDSLLAFDAAEGFLPAGGADGFWSGGDGSVVQWCVSYAEARDVLRDWVANSPSDDPDRDQTVLEAIPNEEPPETVQMAFE